MNILAITQARYGSTRLPAKILKEVNGKTLLEIHLSRILNSKRITKLNVATTTEEGADYIVNIAEKLGVESYKGSVDDVLDRFYQAAKSESPDYVVRLTSDCPIIDATIIDKVINLILETGADYASTDPLSFPDGLDTEVFKFSALEKAYNEAKLQSEREHVTPYIWKNGSLQGGKIFHSEKLVSPEDYSSFRLTVDTLEDYELVKHLIEELGDKENFETYVEYLKSNPKSLEINNMYSRNEGYTRSIEKDKLIK